MVIKRGLLFIVVVMMFSSFVFGVDNVPFLRISGVTDAHGQLIGKSVSYDYTVFVSGQSITLEYCVYNDPNSLLYMDSEFDGHGYVNLDSLPSNLQREFEDQGVLSGEGYIGLGYKPVCGYGMTSENCIIEKVPISSSPGDYDCSKKDYNQILRLSELADGHFEFTKVSDLALDPQYDYLLCCEDITSQISISLTLDDPQESADGLNMQWGGDCTISGQCPCQTINDVPNSCPPDTGFVCSNGMCVLDDWSGDCRISGQCPCQTVNGVPNSCPPDTDFTCAGGLCVEGWSGDCTKPGQCPCQTVNGVSNSCPPGYGLECINRMCLAASPEPICAYGAYVEDRGIYGVINMWADQSIKNSHFVCTLTFPDDGEFTTNEWDSYDYYSLFESDSPFDRIDCYRDEEYTDKIDYANYEFFNTGLYSLYSKDSSEIESLYCILYLANSPKLNIQIFSLAPLMDYLYCEGNDCEYYLPLGIDYSEATVSCSPITTTPGGFFTTEASMCMDPACGESSLCVWGQQTGGCVADVDCGEGQYCDDNSECQPISPNIELCNDGLDNDGDGAIDCGDIIDCSNEQVCGGTGSCELDADCETNEICDGGMCILNIDCNAEIDCPQDMVCSEDNICVAPGSGQNCESNSDCDTGEICSVLGVCFVGCESNSDCDTGEICSNEVCVGQGGCNPLDPDSCPGDQTCSSLTFECQGPGATCSDANPCVNGLDCQEGICGGPGSDCVTDAECVSGVCNEDLSICEGGEGDGCTVENQVTDCASDLCDQTTFTCIGNAGCSTVDRDNDGFYACWDNCEGDENAGESMQRDFCELDMGGCYNPSQADEDSDSIGDECDLCLGTTGSIEIDEMNDGCNGDDGENQNPDDQDDNGNGYKACEELGGVYCGRHNCKPGAVTVVGVSEPSQRDGSCCKEFPLVYIQSTFDTVCFYDGYDYTTGSTVSYVYGACNDPDADGEGTLDVYKSDDSTILVRTEPCTTIPGNVKGNDADFSSLFGLTLCLGLLVSYYFFRRK